MEVSVLDPSHGGYITVAAQQEREALSRSPSPAGSDDIFSVTSDNSSQSSNGDSDEESYASVSKATVALHNSVCETASAQASTSAVGDCTIAFRSQHPRRSFSSTKTPPSLPRQEERKVLFVNDLVDSATSLVSVIWPSSGVPCPQTRGNRGVLPLRRYIEETLRRSRTSYSTLQVALYYLILVKSHVSRIDLTVEPDAERRAMHCGRRMFLSALILASKYLQDRNYSAKAWSKMSGLKTTEINSNERYFLAAVDWQLHIPEARFKLWTDIVLRYTAPPAAVSGFCAPLSESKALWARVIPLLTPALDDPRIMTLPLDDRSSVIMGPPSGFLTPASTPTPPPTISFEPDVSFNPVELAKGDTYPATICPRFLEPRPDMLPPTPGLARMGPLPTPQMTPFSAVNTPAASSCSSRRPSMSMAMAQAQNNTFGRMTLDRLATIAMSQRSAYARYPSLAPSIGLSSPESMISDLTRSSRSSSISSVSTMLTSAPRCAPPARSATGQSVGIEVINLESASTKNGTAEHPIVVDSPETICLDRIGRDVSPSNFDLSIVPRQSKKRSRPVTSSPRMISRQTCRLWFWQALIKMSASRRWHHSLLISP